MRWATSEIKVAPLGVVDAPLRAAVHYCVVPSRDVFWPSRNLKLHFQRPLQRFPPGERAVEDLQFGLELVTGPALRRGPRGPSQA